MCRTSEFVSSRTVVREAVPEVGLGVVLADLGPSVASCFPTPDGVRSVMATNLPRGVSTIDTMNVRGPE